MFGHLKKLEVKGQTAEYPMVELKGCPRLIVKPATEANKEYFNEVLRRSAKSIRKAARGDIEVTAEVMDKNRADDRKLFPKFVIVGWIDIKDDQGNDVEFSQDNCQQFVDALPDWIFDGIGVFCRKNSNFVEVDIDQEEADELGKH